MHSGSRSFRREFSLASTSLLLDAYIPPVNLRAFRLEADISGLRVFVMGDGGDERSIEVRTNLAIIGNDFDGVPLADRMDGSLARLGIDRKNRALFGRPDVQNFEVHPLDLHHFREDSMLLHENQVAAVAVKLIAALHARVRGKAILQPQSEVQILLVDGIHIADRGTGTDDRPLLDFECRSWLGLPASFGAGRTITSEQEPPARKILAVEQCGKSLLGNRQTH